MSQLWEVVGGVASGGILVREGQDITSPKASERLSTGAIVKEVTLEGERLQYLLLSGTGPTTGWVGTALNAKQLLVKTDKAPATAETTGTDTSKGGGYAAAAAPVAQAPVAEKPVVDEELKAKYAAAAKEGAKDFDTWCMKYKVLKFPVADCKLRVFCFHNAGSAESVWTAPGPTNQILAWVKERKDVELVAMSYPGRDKMMKTPPHESTSSLCEAMLPVLYDKIADGVPYAVVSHSVGTWVAFEFLMLARKVGLPMPKVAFFSAFPAPHMPKELRPWRVNRGLDEAAMKEEVLNWDKTHFSGPAKIVFQDDWSTTWGPLMRADFRLFDEYEFAHDDEPKFDFPICTFHMGKEHFCKPEMLEMWKDWTTADFVFDTFEEFGHLTCAYQPAQKKVYTERIASILAKHA